MYMKHRDEKEACVGSDDSLYYYVVAAQWMSDWRKFANGERDQPSTIQNRELAERIFKLRKENRLPIHDNLIKFTEPADYYLINQAFWDCF